MAAGAGASFSDLDVTLKASADLTAKQYHLVKVSGEQTVTFSAAGTDNTIGVLQGKPNTNEPAQVRTVQGLVTKAVAGAAIAAGALVMSNAAGRVITRTATNHVVGRALQAAAADGEVIEVSIDIQLVIA